MSNETTGQERPELYRLTKEDVAALEAAGRDVVGWDGRKVSTPRRIGLGEPPPMPNNPMAMAVPMQPSARFGEMSLEDRRIYDEQRQRTRERIIRERATEDETRHQAELVRNEKLRAGYLDTGQKDSDGEPVYAKLEEDVRG